MPDEPVESKAKNTLVKDHKLFLLVNSTAPDACERCDLRKPELPECPRFFCEVKGRGYWQKSKKEPDDNKT